ncbi:MAG: hypothetical protein R2729_28490 [Bryobacteraceae bacterium]
MRIALLTLMSGGLLLAQREATFEERPATIVENDKLELTVLNRGGAFASLVLKSDPAKMSPMWNPIQAARERNEQRRFGDSVGHFVCVDGFGPTSKEEQAAGLQGHGEAHRQPWEQVSASKENGVTRVEWKATLPIVQEVFRRKVEIADGEQVVYVESELESLLGFDRPVNWAEHATIGSPFLTPEKTVVDASVGRCQTRPYDKRPATNHSLASSIDFTYPDAPLAGGGKRNLRAVPSPPNSMDHTGCVLDPLRRLAFITAIRLDKRLLFGYLVRREEYPWLQEWMNYPPNGALARGLEFGTQPFDVSRRQTVDTGSLFGVPAFRWLPAKSKIASRFLMFYTTVPEGFSRVDDVRLENGKIVIEDRGAGKRVELKASLPL